MTDPLIIGQVEALKSSFIWKVDSFTVLDGEIHSKTFSIGTSCPIALRMVLYPKGDKFETYVSLFARPLYQPFEGQIKFSILNGKSKKVNEITYSTAIKESTGMLKWGSSRFINRNELLDPANKFLTNNTLTINCEVAVGSFEPDYAFPLQLKLHSDLTELLELEMFSDITLVVEGFEYKVHKGILSARSRIFKTMFRNLKPRQERYQITDISTNVMNYLLQFIYSERVDPINPNAALHLLKAANIYELDDLKLHCQQELRNNLNVGNVVDYLILAEKNDSNWLKKKAIEFFITHARDIIDTPMYKNMIKSNPELLEEIYLETVKRQG